MVQVRLLGPVEVDDAGPVALGGPKEVAVLATLALHPQSIVSVDLLTEVLWGASPPRSAGKTLQTYVSRLRRVLPPDTLVTTGGGYALQVPPDAVDAARFEALVDDARRADASRSVAILDDALALWRGPALGELDFSDVLRNEAVRLEERRIDAQELRFEQLLASGRHRELVPELHALVTRNPLRERGWGLLMLALYRCGRQADALRAFQEARRVLIDELGVEPGAALRELEAAVLAHDPSLDAPMASTAAPAGGLPAPLARAMQSPLVGRAAELERLRSAWSAVVDGEARVVLLAGEPGIGKTRLVAAAASEAERTGTVLYGRCDEEAILPFQPFVQALRARADAMTLRDVVPSEHRDELFEKVVTELRSLAALRPVLLAVDDVHWADAASLALLRTIVASEPIPGLLLVLPYRDTEVHRGHPLADTLALLRRERGTERLRLGGLSVDDVVALAEDASLGAALHDETSGNPLFVTETLRHLAEAGGSGIPEGVRDVIGRRLARLSDAANEALAVAAVAGLEFDVVDVAAALGVDENEVIAQLDGAAAAGIVAARATVDRYGFSHAIVRSTLYDELSASRRARLHRDLADTLEQRADAPTRLGEIAHHLSCAAQAGEARRAARAAQRAGRAALEQLALEEAPRFFRMALDALELLDAPDLPLRVEMLRELGQAEVALDLATGTTTLRQAVDEARDVDAALHGEAAIALIGIRPMTPPEDVERLQSAIAHVGDADTSLRARLLAHLAIGRSLTASRTDLIAISGEALGIARRVGDAGALATAITARLYALILPTDAEERLGLAAELAQLASELGDEEVGLVAQRYRYLSHVDRGAFDAAWRVAAEHAALARRRRSLVHLDIAEAIGVTRLVAEGRFDDAEAAFPSYVEHATRNTALDAGQVLFPHLLVLRHLQGRTAELVPFVDLLPGERAADIATSVKAMLLAAGGATAPAREIVDAYAERGFDLPENFSWAPAMFHLSCAVTMLADPEAARLLYARLSPFRGLVLSYLGRVVMGAVDDHLARLARCAGERDAAAAHADAARAIYERAGFDAWLARLDVDE